MFEIFFREIFPCMRSFNRCRISFHRYLLNTSTFMMHLPTLGIISIHHDNEQIRFSISFQNMDPFAFPTGIICVRIDTFNGAPGPDDNG